MQRRFTRPVPAVKKHFEAINCAALPTTLLESLLFGYKKGAFTGAVKDHVGLLKSLDGGTLFLDEIGESEPAFQAKLLRVLQPPSGVSSTIREFTPVGGTHPERSDVRIIAATNRDLLLEIQNGTFRDDLYYRIAHISIHLPALRERKIDIVPIAEAMLNAINKEFQAQDSCFKHKIFSSNTKIFLKNHSWRGNVRELNNVILQTVVMSNTDTIQLDEIKAAMAEMPGSSVSDDILNRPFDENFNINELLKNLQVHYIQRAMKEAGNNKTKAARMLGLNSYQALNDQLDRLNIKLKR